MDDIKNIGRNIFPKENEYNLNRTGIIYKITFPNNKYYIGQTVQKLYDRKSHHRRSANNIKSPSYDTHIGRAIRQYGFDNLKWDILYLNVPIEKLDELEIQEIRNYNSYKDGYNSTEGGQHSYNKDASIQKAIKRRKRQEDKQQKLNNIQLRKQEQENKKQIKLFLQEQNQRDKELYKLGKHDRRVQASNIGKQQPKSSQYLGVCFDKKKNKWKASVKHNKKKIHIGMFLTEEEAAKARDQKVKELGLNTRLNFI